LLGDYSFPTLDAILAEPRARWIGCASELNAGYAADGYARIKKVPTPLVTTYGVGELSAMNAVAGAYAERVPIVCLTSSPTLDDRSKQHILHHTLAHGSAHGGYDVFLNSASCSCIAWR
jgi:indolepyruvate decarboxylase